MAGRPARAAGLGAVAAVSLSDVAAPGLRVMGAFCPGPGDDVPAGFGTLVMLGPSEDFWEVLTAAPEFGAPDPVDRWSERVIGAMAKDLGGQAFLPFGGPPYAPFLRWALRTGRAWSSPVGMLVHDTTGLMVSYRGAIALRDRLKIPPPGPRPCDGCDRPCLSACPVGALGPDGYDTDACHRYLDTPAGSACLSGGCLARRVCPASAGAARAAAQSAHHMAYFHPKETV